MRPNENESDETSAEQTDLSQLNSEVTKTVDEFRYMTTESPEKQEIQDRTSQNISSHSARAYQSPKQSLH